VEKNISQRAIETAGGPTRLSEYFSVTPQAIRNWGLRNKIPAEHCFPISCLTGCVFQPHQLRPDIFDENQIAQKK